MALLGAIPQQTLSPAHAALIAAAAVLMPLGLLLLATLAWAGFGGFQPDNTTVLITGAMFLLVWSEVAVRYVHLDDALALAFGVVALLRSSGECPPCQGC